MPCGGSADYPLWGKARIAVRLRREGHTVSESTVGRILERPMDRGEVEPVATFRRNAPHAARRKRPRAKRLPKGRKPRRDRPIPSIPAGGAQAWRRATARNVSRLLDKLQDDRPFPIEAIQADGGSEFKADFESECRNRGIDLFELPPRSPELDGRVERNDGAWRYEFHATWDLPDDDLDDIDRWIDAFADEFDTFRPRHALDGRTPDEHLRSIAAEETSASHMS